MRNSVSSSTYFLLLFLITCFGVSCTNEVQENSIPLFPSAEEGGDAGMARINWIEKMHTGGQDRSSWRAIERKNRKEIRAMLQAQRDLSARTNATDTLFPGFEGTWSERGSNNQAGSVIATTYDSVKQVLYGISAGGSLWKGDLNGSPWEVVEQVRNFGGYVLEGIRLPDGSMRLLLTEDNIPFISDDYGVTWTESSGIPDAINGWGDSRHAVQVQRDGALELYLLSKEGYWQDINLYKSIDTGLTWTVALSGVGFQFNDVALKLPHHYDNPLVLSLETNTLAEITADSVVSHGSALFDDFSISRIRFDGGVTDDELLLYAIDEHKTVLRSADTGRTWIEQATLSENPWNVGIAVNPSNNQELVAGAVDAYVSRNAGRTFTRVNGWAEYYSDPVNKMHADMMSFTTITVAGGEEITVIGNHGGYYLTDDWFGSTFNIGQEGLNVGQFYTVRSHPRYPDYIFGGTQDQGFQLGSGPNGEIIEMEQEISGDYGHLTFTDNGRHLWMVYPGTAVAYWDNPLGGLIDWYTVDSEDESVWLSPVIAHPDVSRNAVLVAGGSAFDDAEGSYILTFEKNLVGIEPTQGDFNFKLESAGGVLSALATNPLNPSIWYTATDNGRFFRSEDAGDSWEQTINFVPDGHYLYGQAIEPSPVLDSTLWLAGNGYNNPAVYRSSDLGETFVADDEGLPNTLVFDLANSDDGSLMFAATEAGPYVYIADSLRWYSLMDATTPMQTYWSVEWVSADSIARFGTYGRGIWDLQINQLSPPDTILVSTIEQLIEFEAYPNPVLNQLTVRSSTPINAYSVVDPSGRIVLREQFSSRTGHLDPLHTAGLSPKLTLQLNTSDWASGVYRVEVETSEGRGVRSVVKR